MAKYEVTRRFYGKREGITYSVGEKIELTDERAKEINAVSKEFIKKVQVKKKPKKDTEK